MRNPMQTGTRVFVFLHDLTLKGYLGREGGNVYVCFCVSSFGKLMSECVCECERASE